MTTAYRALSMRRRGSKIAGKKLPLRSLGIRNDTSPAAVVSTLGRVPLRSLLRVALRSYRSAPTTAAASRSIISCSAIRTALLIRSAPSPARNTSNSSDKAD